MAIEVKRLIKHSERIDTAGKRLRSGEGMWHRASPIYDGGKNLPVVLTSDELDTLIAEFLFHHSGAKYGMRNSIRGSIVWGFVGRMVRRNNHASDVYRAFGRYDVKFVDRIELTLRVCYAVVNHNAAYYSTAR